MTANNNSNISNVYFQTDYVTVSWNEAAQAVIVEWLGYTGGGQGKVQTGNLKGLELLREKRACNYLTNLLQCRVIDPEDQQWIAEVLLPMMTKEGVRYVVTVVPKSILAQFTTNSIWEKIDEVEGVATSPKNGNNVAASTMEEALAWLKSKP